MAGLMSKVARFAASPQGKKLADRAKQVASDPNTKRKIEEIRGKASSKKRTH